MRLLERTEEAARLLRRTWQQASIRSKLMASILLLALAIASTLYILSTEAIKANFEREYRERVLAIARTLQHSINGERLDDPSRLQALLLSIVRSNPSLRLVNVYALRDGVPQVLSSSDPAMVGTEAEPHDLQPLRTRQAVFSEQAHDGTAIIEATVPLFIDYAPAGTIGVYMSVEDRDALIETQRTSTLILTTLGIMLMLATVYLLTERLIVGPVARVSRAASLIAQGHLDTRVPHTGLDEVGRLASSVSSMVEELLEDRRTLEQMAATDGLTGLWNHRYFHERLREELDRAVRLREPLSLIMLDLDQFKAFNDTHGHLAGDEALGLVGKILQNAVRTYDVPCRYGGEEFALIVPGADALAAVEIAERVRQRIAAQDFSGTDGQKIPITASSGVSTYPRDGADPTALVQAADAALYVAKRSGGNVIHVYDPSSESGADETGVSLEKLRNASLGALQAIARAADARENGTRGHSVAVTGYARRLAVALGLRDDEVQTLQVAALLHDVGKIGIPENILSKPGRLTADEWEIVRTHPVVGELMIKRVPSLGKVVSAVLHHHERWDGTGYPDRLKGEQIPFLARLLAVVDSYEAMTAARPYRRALTIEQATDELRKGAGAQFDPRMVETFLELVTTSNEDLCQEEEPVKT